MSAQLVIALTARGGDKIEVWLKPAPLDCQVWRMPFPGPESVTGLGLSECRTARPRCLPGAGFIPRLETLYRYMAPTAISRLLKRISACGGNVAAIVSDNLLD